MMFTIPGEAAKSPSYELSEIIPDNRRRQSPQDLKKAVSEKRVPPALEINHRPERTANIGDVCLLAGEF